MIRAEEIKIRVSLEQLLDRLGYETNRAGFISCPAHSDSSPSLKIYEDGRGWFCFGCQKGGTVIDFYMHVFDVDFSSAVKAIASMFGIEDRKLSRQEQADLARQKIPLRKKTKLEQDIQDSYNQWCRYKTILEHNHKDWNTLLEEACQNIAFAEYLHEELTRRKEELSGNRSTR